MQDTDAARKAELVAATLDYLVDKPLSLLSFRDLAAAIGVGTHTLAYHFGSRAGLVRDVVVAIAERIKDIENDMTGEQSSVDAYFTGIAESWQWTLRPGNRQLQRLEIEAAMLGALDPDRHSAALALHERWLRIGFDALIAFGVGADDAQNEARALVATFQGLQYDYVLTGDTERTTAAFDAAMLMHRARIEELIARPA